MAEEFPGETAFTVVDVGHLTFSEWEGQANALARGLVEAGLPFNGRVGIHLHPQEALHWLVSYAAIHRAGGVAVPMNPRLAPAEVGHMLAHSGASAVVADGELVAQDRGVANDELLMVVDVSADAPDRPTTYSSSTSGSGPTPGSRPLPPVVRWEEIGDQDRSAFEVPRSADDLADILYTSGTTGRPKGVAVRHSNASMVGEVTPSWNGAGWLHASPMFTFAGIALVYTPMKLGLRGIYMPKFDADRWLDVVETEKPMAIFLVPASNSFGTTFLTSVRFSKSSLPAAYCGKASPALSVGS